MPGSHCRPMLPPHADRNKSPSLQDKERMYTVGSLFYAIYFFVSFPMFFRMDEDPKARHMGVGGTECWTVGLRYQSLKGWSGSVDT